MSEELNRRASDHSPSRLFIDNIVKGLTGNPSVAVLLGALGLYLWAIFGLTAFPSDIEAYSKMFPVGNSLFWAGSYIFTGTMMIITVGLDYRPFVSLITSSYMVTLWTWAAFARMANVATFQTGNATSVIYIALGLIILFHSARKNARRQD